MAQFGKILNVSRPYTNRCLTLSPGLQHLNPLFTTRYISTSSYKYDQKEVSEHVSPDAGALSTGQKGICLTFFTTLLLYSTLYIMFIAFWSISNKTYLSPYLQKKMISLVILFISS